jgi:hypothetical protein
MNIGGMYVAFGALTLGTGLVLLDDFLRKDSANPSVASKLRMRVPRDFLF